MFVHALSGAPSFAACVGLFRSYPLAVSRFPGGWHRAMVLHHRGSAGAGYHVLTRDAAECFTLRPWDPAAGPAHEIRPGRPVPAASHQVIAEGMPLPRDGALLGWVSDRQTTVLLPVHHGHPDMRRSGPQARSLAMVGSETVRWPPFIASPLDDGRLWEYVDRGEIVDLEPVVARAAGTAAWVPSQNSGRAAQGHGCVVVRQNMTADDFWVPEGIYMDHWMLREGVPTPPASHLLTLPGATDLTRRLTTWGAGPRPSRLTSR
ncbi:MAG TPA: hypothetical protein VGD91_24740 [Trebonia sp.]